MSLVKNDAAEIAAKDKGLSASPDATHVKESLSLANKDWKEAKAALDKMGEEELTEFINALEGIPLLKTGYVRVRLTPREYATLRKRALENETTVTNILTR